jgi:hypothetical protein
MDSKWLDNGPKGMVHLSMVEAGAAASEVTKVTPAHRRIDSYAREVLDTGSMMRFFGKPAKRSKELSAWTNKQADGE